MNQTISDKVRWTTADLELLPDNGDRYEIIDGELFMTRAPHWGHQQSLWQPLLDLILGRADWFGTSRHQSGSYFHGR
jgi:hypothetical protein